MFYRKDVEDGLFGLGIVGVCVGGEFCLDGLCGCWLCELIVM